MKKNILVTGGTGYIGSHTAVELINAGYGVIIADNLVNSEIGVLDKIQEITGVRPKFFRADVRDKSALRKIFSENDIDGIIHFAGLKAVGESCREPVSYYDNNLISTIFLLEVMKEYKVSKFVFSSSATVYGEPERLPLDEECSLNPNSPYGRTKLMTEQILKDLYNSDNTLKIVILRYFNPVGAHISGLIGENPKGIPNNLTPYVAKVAAGELEAVNVFGNDYNTPDGTGVRDYIHVTDLAQGHVKAMEKINRSGLYIYNLGTGKGYSVLEVINAFERACGKKIPVKIAERRAGDIASYYASPLKAEKELGFKASFSLDDMCRSLWNFMLKQKENGSNSNE